MDLDSLLPASQSQLNETSGFYEGHDLCQVVLGPVANFSSITYTCHFFRGEPISLVLFVMNCATTVILVKNAFLKDVLSKSTDGSNG